MRVMTGTGARLVVSGLRLAVAGVVLAAVVVQLARTTGTVVNFFSFFTIQSNVIGAAAMITAALAWRARDTVWLSQFRGAATLYMGITGVVYNVLLRGLEDTLQTPIPWINTVLHVAFPILIVADWLLDRTVHPLSFRQGLVFLLYPIAYLGYTLIRGPIADWYPYPFLDPREHGYGYVTIMCLFVAVICLLLAWVLCWTSRWGSARRADRPPVSEPVR